MSENFSEEGEGYEIFISPSSTDLKKVEEGTQLLLGDIKSEKELEIQVEFQENVPLTMHETAITCILPVRNRHIIIGD